MGMNWGCVRGTVAAYGWNSSGEGVHVELEAGGKDGKQGKPSVSHAESHLPSRWFCVGGDGAWTGCPNKGSLCVSHVLWFTSGPLLPLRGFAGFHDDWSNGNVARVFPNLQKALKNTTSSYVFFTVAETQGYVSSFHCSPPFLQAQGSDVSSF